MATDETSVGYAIKRAQAALNTAMEHALRDAAAIGVSQFACLTVLSTRPDISNADLARAVFVSRQATHQLLGGLTDAGLVQVRGSGRQTRLALSERGRATLSRARAAAEIVEQAMIGGIPTHRAAQLRADLDACSRALDPDGKDFTDTAHRTGGDGLATRALSVAERLAGEAAEAMLATPGREAAPTVKAHALDWVTATDLAVETSTRIVLGAEFPQIDVLGEEFSGGAAVALPGEVDGPELLWIVDPVDGTSNYVSGLPLYAYALGLADAHGPVVGVVAAPGWGETFSATRGLGLRRNGEPFRPEPVLALSGRLLTVEAHGQRPDWRALSRQCRRRQVGMRWLGSTALALTQAAVGRTAAAILPAGGYSPWDIAGPAALAVEAGLRVTDLDGVGTPFPWRSTNGLVAAWPDVADDVLEMVASANQ